MITVNRKGLLSTCTAIALIALSQTASATGLLPPEPAVEKPPAAKADTRSEPQPDTVELAALYYYAQQGQQDRIDREIRRLSLKYPNFAAPDDLFQSPDETQVDETSLWQLYEQDDYPAIEHEISRIAADNPGWEPSLDFQQKLLRRKQRFDMTRAAEAKDWPAVIAAGKDLNPETEAEVDLLWLLIDAYRDNGLIDAATPIYRGILFRKGDQRFDDDVIMTTLQKAVQDFPASELRQAIRILSTSPDLAARMQELTLDLLRRDVADFSAGLAGATEPPPVTVLAVRRSAERENNNKDQLLLGWYYLKINEESEAEDWFRRALSGAPSVEALKGLGLTLTHAKKEPEAFKLVSEHLDLAAKDWEVFLGSLSYVFQAKTGAEIAPDVANAYAEAIQSSQSPEHAELLGWYAYNSKQFEAADAWFGKAFEWKPSAESLKGQALTSIQRKDRQKLEGLKAQYQDSYPQVFAELKTAAAPSGSKGQTVTGPSSQGAPRYFQSFKAKRYGECLGELQRLESRGNLSADAQLIRGWCSLELGHLAEARNAFETALGGGSAKRGDAAYGLGLTLLRARLTEDAEMLLARESMSADRQRELRLEVLWQKARTAFDGKRYADVLSALNARLQIAPETVGMSQMRAWAHYHLGNLGQSRAIFAQLNQVVEDPANSRGIAVINERMKGTQ